MIRGSRVDAVRWNEFLGVQEAENEDAPVQSEPQPVPSGMQICSAAMRICGTIDVDAIAAELKRIFDGTTQGEIEISFSAKDK